ncbi:hypothetical protein ABT052_22410 [Streptomyces sp. NPDC002766]|uniref:hypothetical protein n=1 Tax=unclassified Streptomyces TaxID=2593676 RepID=UPI00331A8491
MARAGSVTARDSTHRPAGALDIRQAADQLPDSRHPRIKYVIANRRIATTSQLPRMCARTAQGS